MELDVVTLFPCKVLSNAITRAAATLPNLHTYGVPRTFDDDFEFVLRVHTLIVRDTDLPLELVWWSQLARNLPCLRVLKIFESREGKTGPPADARKALAHVLILFECAQ